MSASTEAATEWKDATRYEKWFESHLGRAYGESVNAIVRPWVEAARPTSVLDVGCGPGITAGSVVPVGVRLLELDCNFLMAARAAFRLGAEGRNISSIVGTCSRIPLRAASVDLVLCVNCLEFVKERDRAFAELRRVLRPGGTAIVGVLNAASPWEITRRLKAPFVSEERTYYKRGRFFRAEELEGDLHGAGLEPAELRLGVHFPPISARPGVYRVFERVMTRLAPTRGAMILARSIARA